MNVTRTDLPGVLLIEPDVFADERGYFLETHREDRYAAAGIPDVFTQDNISFSQEGVLRGLHLQWPRAQGKLVYVLSGSVFDVVVDVRRGSETYGKWFGHTLSAKKHNQLWIPGGFAHGFVVTSESALFAYKCTEGYDPTCELAIRWNDPEIAIEWPVAEPVLSEKDAAAPLLKDVDADDLPST